MTSKMNNNKIIAISAAAVLVMLCESYALTGAFAMLCIIWLVVDLRKEVG